MTIHAPVGRLSAWAQKQDKLGALILLVVLSTAGAGWRAMLLALGAVALWVVLFNPFPKVSDQQTDLRPLP
jgi:uncharacterized membrane protein YeiH